MHYVTNILLVSILVAMSPLLLGADQRPKVVEIRFHDHRFDPAVVTVPAGVPLELRVVNDGPKAIEFEVFSLHIEEVIGPGRTRFIPVPALKPGSHEFVDDFDDAVKAGEIRAQ
jgi:hypothetical protein